MADKKFTMHRYNGTSFDTLYPETTIEQVQDLQTELDSKQDDLTATSTDKDKFLHSNSSTGSPEWVQVDKNTVGLGNVDNTSDATKKSNFTGSIASGNTGFTTGGDVYTGLAGKQSAIIYSALQPASQSIGDWWYEDTTINPQLFQPLTFTANTAGSTVTLNKYGSPAWTGSYSTDGTTWNTYIPSTTGAITLTNVGDKVYFKGDISGNFSSSTYIRFSLSGSISASGNCNSMYVSSGFENLTTLVYNYCYSGMFTWCTALTSAPLLPAITLSLYCYNYMFQGCSSLTVAPELPATMLATGCYYNMFGMCSQLTTAQSVLPATTLAAECYYFMFSSCSNLTTVPKISATSLNNSDSRGMFTGCTSLQVSDTQTTAAQYAWRIPSIGTFTNTSSQPDMFRNCAGTRSTDSPTFTAGTSVTYYTQNESV